jgi:hypothetical protein
MPSHTDTLTCLQRTAKAWRLLPHPNTLGRKAHALLLLANGHRSIRELSVLVGVNVAPLARQLMEQGLLQRVPVEQTSAC